MSDQSIPAEAELASWFQRSRAVRAMLNPALLAAILAAATEEYARLSRKPMPAAYAFLIVPLVLHRETRESLPPTNRSHWSTWVGNNPLLVVGFPSRAIAMRDHVREGLRLALRSGTLAIDESGGGLWG